MNGNDNNGDYITRFLGKSSHVVQIGLNSFNSTTKKRTTTQNVTLVQRYYSKSFNSLTTLLIFCTIAECVKQGRFSSLGCCQPYQELDNDLIIIIIIMNRWQIIFLKERYLQLGCNGRPGRFFGRIEQVIIGDPAASSEGLTSYYSFMIGRHFDFAQSGAKSRPTQVPQQESGCSGARVGNTDQIYAI